MATPLRLLSILCWLCAVIMMGYTIVFQWLGPDGQFLWDWVFDPIILTTFVIIVVVNTIISLNRRNDGAHLEQLPMDIFTMAAGFTGTMYIVNYIRKFITEVAPVNNLLWDFIVPATMLVMVVSAIFYWREANRAGG